MLNECTRNLCQMSREFVNKSCPNAWHTEVRAKALKKLDKCAILCTGDNHGEKQTSSRKSDQKEVAA